MTERRVVAEGWGQQGSGSVFCADSSLRFIYETHQAPQHPAAAAITSLAAGGAVGSKAPAPTAPLSGTFFMDQLKGTGTSSSAATSYYGAPTSMYPLLDDRKSGSSSSFAGKRPREGSSDLSTSNGRVGGVDLHEAEVARACTAITRQVPSLPHSFRECSVCLSANAYAQIGVCGHTFHGPCFLRWFRQNRSCPLCRGPVDRVQLAPVVSVQDELEAIMAEIDDEPLDAKALAADALLEPSELISFLAADFDADMDMAALDDPAVAMELDAPEPKAEPVPVPPVPVPAVPTPVQAPAPVPTPQQPPTMQFAPTSTMPNYWNVLNQGLASIPPPVAPAPPRMVHIAPKPDARFAAPAVAPRPLAPAPSSSVPTVVTPPGASTSTSTSPTAAPRVVSCRCTGGCRNGRCACVKEGGMCGVSCRCTSCKNPFLMVKAAGADIDALLTDSCFMHNVSKTRDMVARLQEPVAVPCCGRATKVLACVQGFACAPCGRRFDFSWCVNKLLDADKTPRNHCDICKRCCDHRDVHCADCGRCYFAGVAASLPCPCREAAQHKKRREAAEAPAAKTPPAADDDDGDGECCIM